ncbi:MAG: hypothetical protein ACO1SX_08000 [Actinomycetota bacterium]
MLEGLDRIDWSRLTDGYGAAEHVPDDIRALASSNSDARNEALRRLSGTIFHQGSRYRASAPAVPFLFEVLTAPETRGRCEIIQLLLMLAVGYPDRHLPFGLDLTREFRAVEKLARKVDLDRIRTGAPCEDDDWDEGYIALWARDTYEAVEREIRVFRELARDPEEAVRRSAVRALAWFPREAQASVGIVRAVAAGVASTEERANAVVCRGILDRSLQERGDVALFQGLLAPDQPGELRLAAALALGAVLEKALPEEALAVLLEVIADTLAGIGPHSLDGWCYGGPATLAASVLTEIRPRPGENVVTALCKAAATNTTWARAQIWTALLSIVFRRPKPVQWVEDASLRSGVRGVYVDPQKLTRRQTRALEAISRNPIWEERDSLSDHHMDVAYAFGFPWYGEKLRALVATAREKWGEPLQQQ